MNFPHEYSATAHAQTDGNVRIQATNLPELESAPPKEFGGPGDQWSPEDLLVAAVSDCFVLSFRAIAAMSKFDWVDLQCHVTGTLDKVERDIQFTAFQVHAKLTIPADGDEAKAQRILEKAEGMCFITNSLKAEPHLQSEIVKSGD